MRMWRKKERTHIDRLFGDVRKFLRQGINISDEMESLGYLLNTSTKDVRTVPRRGIVKD